MDTMSALPVPQPEDSDKHLPIDSKLIGKINKTPKVPFNSEQVRGLRRQTSGYTGYVLIPMRQGDFSLEDVHLIPDVLNLIREVPEKE
jgi:hypothetical protein